MFVSGKVTADSYKPDDVGILTFNRGEAVKLDGSAKLGLTMSMQYRIIETEDVDRGPWKITTVGYMYGLELGDTGPV